MIKKMVLKNVLKTRKYTANNRGPSTIIGYARFWNKRGQVEFKNTWFNRIFHLTHDIGR